MKINFFKKENNFKKKNRNFNPFVLWNFIFYGGFLVTLLFFLFGFYFFKSVNTEYVFEEKDINSEQIIEKERIDEVLEFFANRKKKSDQILNSPVPIIDPSL